MRRLRPVILGPRAAGIALVFLGVIALISLWLASPPLAGAQLDTDSPPPVIDRLSCGHFESQAAAQEYFETFELEFPEVLDGDGDGIACEFAFGGEEDVESADAPAESSVVGLPSTGNQPTSDSGGKIFLLLAVVTGVGALMLDGRMRSRR